jgi:hypothetical protein
MEMSRDNSMAEQMEHNLVAPWAVSKDWSVAVQLVLSKAAHLVDRLVYLRAALLVARSVCWTVQSKVLQKVEQKVRS